MEAPALVSFLVDIFIHNHGIGHGLQPYAEIGEPDDDEDPDEEMVFLGLEKALMSMRYLAAAGARESLATEGICLRS